MAEVKLEDLKGNSNTEKEEQRRVKRPVTTNVKVKEKKPRSKLAEAFLGEEIDSLKDYIVYDVIIPAIKNTIVDSVSDAVGMMFGVTPRGRRKDSGYVSYSTYYKSGGRDRRRNDDADRNSRYDYRDITFASRVEAEEVLDNLRDLIEDYEEASVADLYDLCNITADFTDNKFGWVSLRNARVVRVRGGYELDLPRPRPLD